jgi:hypothetical protein
MVAYTNKQVNITTSKEGIGFTCRHGALPNARASIATDLMVWRLDAF